MATLMTWIGPGLDGLAILLLAAVLWRLGRDPATVWAEREQRLQTIFEELRTLVAQSEGLARDLDAKLAAREERLQGLLTTAEAASARGPAAVAPRGEDAPAPADVDEATIASRIEALAATGTTAEEIARRLAVAPAEVRLVIGLRAARSARRRTALADPRAQAS